MKRTKILVRWLIQLRVFTFSSWAALRPNQISQAVETGQSGRLRYRDTSASKDDEIPFILGIDNFRREFNCAVNHQIPVLSWIVEYFIDNHSMGVEIGSKYGERNDSEGVDGFSGIEEGERWMAYFGTILLFCQASGLFLWERNEIFSKLCKGFLVDWRLNIRNASNFPMMTMLNNRMLKKTLKRLEVPPPDPAARGRALERSLTAFRHAQRGRTEGEASVSEAIERPPLSRP